MTPEGSAAAAAAAAAAASRRRAGRRAEPPPPVRRDRRRRSRAVAAAAAAPAAAARRRSPSAVVPAGPRALTAIDVKKQADGLVVTLQGNGPLSYEYFLVEGKSLVVDIAEAATRSGR